MFDRFAGRLDPHRPEDDTDGAQARDRSDTEIQHVPRRPKNVVFEHKQREGVGQRHLHVPSEHGSDDQPDRLPASGRYVIGMFSFGLFLPTKKKKNSRLYVQCLSELIVLVRPRARN